VLWCCGAVVLWYCRAVVLCFGAVVLCAVVLWFSKLESFVELELDL
jgi:hypothetical protein